MKVIMLFVALTWSISSYSQTLQNLYASTRLLDLSSEGEKAFNEHLKRCEELWAKDYKTLNAPEIAFLDGCSEVEQDYWDPVGGGCSWYCGGGPDSIYASSYLYAQGTINYHPANAHDLNFKNAWVEGASGDGVGEYLVYHFHAGSPRITSLYIVSGYVKSQADWENNGRVKKLKLYFNDKPLAILQLENCRCEQAFDLALGYDPDLKKEWTLKFEIMEVYPGKKYDDTVISEIYFDGIDVH